MEDQNGQKSVPQLDLPTESEMDETWQTLADCKISLPLARLLQLVSRFTEKVATIVRQIQSYQDNSRSRHEERYDNRYETES